MFDFTSMFSDHIERIKPHAAQFADEARSYCDAVIERLDFILHELQDDGFVEQRVYSEGSVAALTSTPLKLTVPPAELWELEAVTIRADNSDALFQIFDSSSTGVGLGAGQVPVWGGKTWAGGGITYGGNGIILTGNSELYALCTVACEYRLQFKRRMYKRPKLITGPGMPQGVDDTVDTIEDTETARHTGTWTPAR